MVSPMGVKPEPSLGRVGLTRGVELRHLVELREVSRLAAANRLPAPLPGPCRARQGPS